jgi:putative ABC transport system substrate-binding protein
LACVGLGYYRPGFAAARPLSRVLLGESPAGIPMENVSEKAVWIDQSQAAKLGIKFPDELLKEADEAAGKAGDKLKEASADQKSGEKVN